MVTYIRKNCKLQAESDMTSFFFFFGGTDAVTYLLQKKKKCLADSTGLLSLLETLLKQHEG